MKVLRLNQKHVRVSLLTVAAIVLLAVVGIKAKEFYDIANCELYFKNHKNTLSMIETDREQINVFISPRFEEDLTYTSSDIKVADVDDKGVIVGMGEGHAEITIETKHANKKISMGVDVAKRIDPKKLNVSNTKDFLELTKTLQLKTTITPSNATNKNIIFESSDSKIATIDKNGLIKPLEKGTVTISVSINNTDLKKTFQLDVIDEIIPLKSISLSEGSEGSIEYNQTMTLHPVLNPLDTTYKNVKYKTNDKSIATVDENGVITAHRPGLATITCTSKEKKNISTTFKLTVKNETGFLSNNELNTHVGNSTKLMVVAHPDDETLWGGGNLSEGNWFVICLTNGYNKTRTAEYKKALSILGARGIILNYPDLIYNSRSDWSMCKAGIEKDLVTAFKYKNWEKIVTHNPEGEYGHVHHKMTNALSKSASNTTNTLNKLYYFGHFYKSPDQSFSTISEGMLSSKQSALDAYSSQINAINAKWRQMAPYENWIKASEW